MLLKFVLKYGNTVAYMYCDYNYMAAPDKILVYLDYCQQQK